MQRYLSKEAVNVVHTGYRAFICELIGSLQNFDEKVDWREENLYSADSDMLLS